MNNRQQTPLEKLLAEKSRLQNECKIQEEKLNNTLSVIQENAGSLLLSGLSSLLFPANKTKNKKQETVKTETQADVQPVSIGLKDYLSIAKSMSPIIWEIIQPLMINWGIRKARKLVASIFSSKKKQDLTFN